MDPFSSPSGGKKVEHKYKANSSQMHIFIDLSYKAVAVTTAAANGGETKEVEKLLNRIQPRLTA